MINEYVNKLIDNLPDDITNTTSPIVIDIVLDGGIFNGSYLVGAMYFLKEMEKRKYIKINRISGCSIGSVVAFCYFIDALDCIPDFYAIAYKNFKKTRKLSIIKKIKKIFANYIDDNICQYVNNRLYITYNNIKKGSKPVKSYYKNVDEIMSTIIRSCYVPYLIDGNILYKNTSVDGILPYIFKKEPNTKILYLELFTYDKLGNLLNVKNEKTNFHRILSGLLEIHSFFIKKSNTYMCSYVDEWSITNYLTYYIKLLIEKICIYTITIFIFIKNKIPHDFKDTVLYKFSSIIFYDIFSLLLETYCL
jgi:hypothetical protein